MFRRMMTFDPGMNSTGWAYWEEVVEAKVPYQYGLIPIRSSVRLEWRSKELWTKLVNLIGSIRPSFVVIEWPQMFAFSGKGMTCAARGDLGVLYLAASMIVAASWESEVEEIELINPFVWKGNLSKRMVEKRVMARVGIRYPDHVLDAVALGFYVIDRGPRNQGAENGVG